MNHLVLVSSRGPKLDTQIACTCDLRFHETTVFSREDSPLRRYPVSRDVACQPNPIFLWKDLQKATGVLVRSLGWALSPLSTCTRSPRSRFPCEWKRRHLNKFRIGLTINNVSYGLLGDVKVIGDGRYGLTTQSTLAGGIDLPCGQRPVPSSPPLAKRAEGCRATRVFFPCNPLKILKVVIGLLMVYMVNNMFWRRRWSKPSHSNQVMDVEGADSLLERHHLITDFLGPLAAHQLLREDRPDLSGV